MILKSFVKKFRQIEGSSALLRQNVNKLSRTFRLMRYVILIDFFAIVFLARKIQSFKLIFIFAGCSAKTNVREA